MHEQNIKKFLQLRHLLSIEGLGPGKLHNLLNYFNDLDEIFEASKEKIGNVDLIGKSLAMNIRRKCNQKITDESYFREIERLNELGTDIITCLDDEYPFPLKNIYNPPVIIYVKGKLLKEDDTSVAIVGTRKPTSYGIRSAEIISGELASKGITIISGMARGIDSIAHKAALKNKGRTIAVIGSGMNVIYPSENKILFDHIVDSGAVISEFPLDTKPDHQNFPQRNRVISGLSLATLVVETRKKGGAMQTANYAFDQNREVFAVPGNIFIPQSEGTNELIKRQEAKLISNSEDIIKELNLEPSLKTKNEMMIELSLFEQQIYDCLEYDPKHIDKISTDTNMSISDCLVHLLSMEFKDVIKQLPGKMFMRL